MLESLLAYSGTFSISVFFGTLYKKTESKLLKFVIFILIILPPILLSAYRVGVGTDYYGYFESFRSIKNSVTFSSIFSFYQEPGWVILNLISPDYFSVLLLSSIIYSLFITLAIFRLKEKIGIVFPLIISYLVFYSLSFNGIRQAIAAAIFLFALSFIEKSKIKYILLICFAALFHKSVLACIFLMFLYRNKKTKLLYAFSISAFFTLAVLLFAPYIKSVFSSLHLYSSYLDTESSAGYGFFLYLIPVIVLLCYTSYIGKIKDKYFVFLLIVFLLQIPFQLLARDISYADRIAEYGLISQVILVPYSISFIKNKNNKRFVISLYMAWYIFYYIIMFVILKSNGVYPYFIQ